MRERRPKAKEKAVVAEAGPVTLSQMVEELAETLRRHDLSELSIENDGMKIQLKRGGAAPVVAAAPLMASAPVAAAAPAPAPAAPAPKAETSDGNVSYLTSPFVGTFYRSPGPEAAPFVDVGTRFKKGQVLCIVEAMKLMNEIEAELDGTVVQVLVENGHPVEYGEPLFKIKQG
jgi:acetyl-CoA carboxylase biotin carboxyl carrier protein